jgi:hypothetical protein
MKKLGVTEMIKVFNRMSLLTCVSSGQQGFDNSCLHGYGTSCLCKSDAILRFYWMRDPTKDAAKKKK